jgi:Ni/Co efflux regulator RcnB
MTSIQRPARLLALLFASLVAAAPVLAKDHGEGHGNKHGDKHEKKARHDDDHERHGDKERREPKHGAYFDERNRDAVHRYYTSHPGKFCPPGLAKKHNGCMPPGQAKKEWQVGAPLPRTVYVAPVPQQIIVSLPRPPSGHKYVQVSGDVLLVAVGSMMVVDGINGLMNR